MVVIRRLDAVLEPTKQAMLDMKANLDKAGITNQDAPLNQAAGQAFYNSSPFTLRDLRARGRTQQLRSDFESYLDGFSPNVQDILEKFQFRHQVPRLVERDVLGILFEKFLDYSINLSPIDVRYLGGADRDQLDPILDQSVASYIETLDEDGQVDFKGKAKAFQRTYGFLASVLPYTNAGWEKLSIFLNFLIPKLPAPIEDDLSKGILEAIDMDSYRVEVQASMSIGLADEDAEIDPVPTSGGGRVPELEMDRLSNIIREFNDQFGNIQWNDTDKIRTVITEEIPAKVAADIAYQNAMKNSDRQNARIEHDKALQRVLVSLLSDHTQLFKEFSDNPNFKRWLADTVFNETYQPA